MDTYELLEELSKRSSEEIEFCLLMLIIKNKIKYIDLSNAYTSFLEKSNSENKDKYLNTLYTLFSTYQTIPKGKKINNFMKSALFILNESKMFNEIKDSRVDINNLTVKECIAPAFQYLYEEKND